MKHLKLFEQSLQEYWLVDYYIDNDKTHNYKLFPDIHSAENYIITIINEERKQLEDNYNDSKYFTDVDEALNWYEETCNDIDINYHKLKIEKPFEGTDKLKRMRDVKKYNL